MSELAASLRNRAKKQIQGRKRKRKDPRFLRVMGKLVGAKLLTTNVEGISSYSGQVKFTDLLRAGQIEPRIFELLPAIVLKKPGLFTGTDDLPDDLHAIVRAIRRGEAVEAFRGVPASDYLPWVVKIGHKGKQPTLLKSFRMTQEDIVLLRELKTKLATSETEVIRRALRVLAGE
ncbi:MAG: hypothetical protein JKY56_12000 [Kofleriaceae bacterium]|nr:hypothetical protein [Kofleriaceae bacterium]